MIIKEYRVTMPMTVEEYQVPESLLSFFFCLPAKLPNINNLFEHSLFILVIIRLTLITSRFRIRIELMRIRIRIRIQHFF